MMKTQYIATPDEQLYQRIPDYDPDTETCRTCGNTVAHFSDPDRDGSRLLLPGEAYLECGVAYGLCHCPDPAGQTPE
jgi:hypothetical protein